ncbi:MAG: FtsX-like permease family protein [Bacteroidota bacterium]|nr:FtsX-like permease family protein [Bacteroidota bacterium]
MIAFKLSIRNLLGAGLRTWLNVIVLSITFILIILLHGFIEGWNREAMTDMKEWEIGGGQYWHTEYDPHDSFTLEDSHRDIPKSVLSGTQKGTYCPVLISQATIYPQGRMRNILMKGIDPDQQILALPTSSLKGDYNEIPVIIGTAMATATKFEKGDITTIRWRDVNGTFDATEIVITDIFKTNVPTVDAAQVWMPLSTMQEITGMPNEATLIVVKEEMTDPDPIPGWEFKDTEFLLSAITDTIKTKTIGTSFIYVVFLALGLLAVFDTQVLSIFRRQKEIGTYIALGMTRKQVVGIFTVEGAMHSILAVLLGAAWGIPLLFWMSNTGFAIPVSVDEFGLAMAERIYPAYGLGLIIMTLLLIVISTTIVSYLPSRRISKMNPTEAIRGKAQ